MPYWKNLVICWACNLSKMEPLLFLNLFSPCWDAFPDFSNVTSYLSSSRASTLSPPFIDNVSGSLKSSSHWMEISFVFSPPNNPPTMGSLFISFQLRTKKASCPSKDQTTCPSHPFPTHLLEDLVSPLVSRLFLVFRVSSQQGQVQTSIFKNSFFKKKKNSFFGLVPLPRDCSTSQLSCSKNCDHNLLCFLTPQRDEFGPHQVCCDNLPGLLGFTFVHSCGEARMIYFLKNCFQ